MVTRDLLGPGFARDLFAVLMDDGFRPIVKMAFITGHSAAAYVNKDAIFARLDHLVAGLDRRCQRVTIGDHIARMSLTGLTNADVGKFVVIAPARKIHRDPA